MIYKSKGENLKESLFMKRKMMKNKMIKSIDNKNINF